MWKEIICRYGVPHTIITDNGRQFIDKELAKFYTGLGIKHITSSVEHPQTNGQAKAANKVILVELRKRLDTAKGRWPEELIEVIWAYRCTPQSSTNESPFSLVYGANAMIPVEIGEPSLHRELYDPTHQPILTSRPSMENGQQRQEEGWQILRQLGWPVPHTRRCRRRSLSPRTIIWGRDSQHLECIPPQVLLQLSVYCNRTNTCNRGCTLFPHLVFFP